MLDRESKWVVAAKRADFKGIGERFQIDPVIARIIRNRDLVGDEEIGKYLTGGMGDLYSPSAMRDLDLAADLILDMVREKKKVRVIGDYDIDGVSSTAILVKGLGRIGLSVDARIPERIRDGYGLNDQLIRQAAEDGVRALITCDNGIAAFDAIALGNELGIETIVTDHHEVPTVEGASGDRVQQLPPARAVIDPKRSDCSYPFEGLCGAGIAWKLVAALYERLGLPEAELAPLLELAAIATIGDVMQLVDENRILVREGLKLIRKTKNPGLRELILQNHLDMEKIDSYHIGFVIGPCLNASGRLDTAERALALLLTEDRAEAACLAADLIALNQSRKEMTRLGEEEAIGLVESGAFSSDRVLVLYLPEVHESLAGLIAGRVRDRFHRPCLVITRTEDGTCKGSGRSVEAYHMYKELDRVRPLFLKMGGHPMAAGFSLTEENVDRLRRELNEACTLTEDELCPKVVIDVPMPLSYLYGGLVDQLEVLRPYGNGNPRPVFADKNIRLKHVRVMGKNRNVVKMAAESPDGSILPALIFGEGDRIAGELGREPVRSILYYPEWNDYGGRRSLQIVISSYR